MCHKSCIRLDVFLLLADVDGSGHERWAGIQSKDGLYDCQKFQDMEKAWLNVKVRVHSY